MQDFLSLIFERMPENFDVPSFEGERAHTHALYTKTHTHIHVNTHKHLTLVTLSKSRNLWPSEYKD